MENLSNKEIINNSYKFCKKITYNHYENFPVASILLPRKLRSPIIAIYTYARYADDIVDSPILSENKKLKLVNNLENIIINLDKTSFNDIKTITNNKPNLKFIAHLKDSINKHNISNYLLLDLLKAFKQDITTSSYLNLNSVLEYCKNSANPIGRLLLELNNISNQEALIASDAICTALQLINFMQDIKSDYIERNRCYIPLDILNKYSLDPVDINSKNPQLNWIKARNEILLYSENLILNNKNILLTNLKGRFKLELKAIITSALFLANKFKAFNYAQDNIFARPYLTKLDFLKIFILAVRGQLAFKGWHP